MSSNGIGDGGYSPYRTISDATRCVCGHRWGEHTSGICTESDRRRPHPAGSLYAYDLCECNRFEPDDRDDDR